LLADRSPGRLPGGVLDPRAEGFMKGVRLLVGTRKGAFVLTSNADRRQWDVSGPHFAGWELYHLK
jgi:hypothetical protein